MVPSKINMLVMMLIKMIMLLTAQSNTVVRVPSSPKVATTIVVTAIISTARDIATVWTVRILASMLISLTNKDAEGAV